MSDCLFCKIGRDELPSEKVYEDDQVFAIKDINPSAPFHFLVIPRRHVETILDFEESDDEMVGRVYRVAASLARENGFAEDGYRVVANCNKHGGQTVYHVHFHVVGGRPLSWPAG